MTADCCRDISAVAARSGCNSIAHPTRPIDELSIAVQRMKNLPRRLRFIPSSVYRPCNYRGRNSYWLLLRLSNSESPRNNNRKAMSTWESILIHVIIRTSIFAARLAQDRWALSPNVGRYRKTVGRYRIKVSKLESTWSGLLRTSKISRIDPIITKLWCFEKSKTNATFFTWNSGFSRRPKIWRWCM